MTVQPDHLSVEFTAAHLTLEACAHVLAENHSLKLMPHPYPMPLAQNVGFASSILIDSCNVEDEHRGADVAERTRVERHDTRLLDPLVARVISMGIVMTGRR